MRMFVLSVVGIAASFLATERSVSAQQVINSQPVVSTTADVVCPKCGKVHAPPAGATLNPVPSSFQPVASSVASPLPVASSGIARATSGVTNVLASLNAQRARKGIGSLRYDPQLQAVAERRAQQMASRGLKSHPPGSFAPGRYEGVGWSSSYAPSGVSACYTSDRSMTYAGAAMATGRDGVYFAVVYR